MKEEIVQKLIEHQQAQLNGVEENYNIYRENSDFGTERELDIDDLSHADHSDQMEEYLNDEKTLLENNLSQLKLAKDRKNDSVAPGALVEIEDAYFLVGPNFEPTQYNNKNVHPLSTFSVVYHKSKGNKKGQFLILPEKDQEIINIY